MTSPLLISLSLLLLAVQVARAQSADEFFHDGAQSYLTNNVARAREEVDKGLKLFPEDLKLKKLDELLKQQQQEQQSKDDKQKQEQDKKEQQQKEQKQQEQKDQQKQEQKDQKDQKDQPKQPQQPKSADDKKDKKDAAGKPSQPMQPHAMTPQEAKQLLDAQKGDEQVLQFKPQEKPENRGKSLKDW